MSGAGNSAAVVAAGRGEVAETAAGGTVASVFGTPADVGVLGDTTCTAAAAVLVGEVSWAVLRMVMTRSTGGELYAAVVQAIRLAHVVDQFLSVVYGRWLWSSDC